MGNAKLKEDIEGIEDSFADELEPGSELMHGQYKIENFLNAGGFGITYSARDSLDRRVVIKECFPGAFCRRSTALVTARSRAHQSELASIVRLFVQEARSLAKLNHPNIVGVHQVFEENNTAYMALDFIEGRDLLAIIEEEGKEALPPENIERILRKVLDAVGFIHDQGILHRDISPDNILVNDEGEPVLIDFGAAREEATKQSRVLSALRVVKDGYSPQEFYIAGSEQGPYSDLYALGATFYHLITGELPPNSQARLSAVASGETDPYQHLAGRFPQYNNLMLKSIDQALAILPKDRISSAAAWVDLMDGKAVAVEETPKAKAVPGPAATPIAVAETKPKSRKGLLLATAAVIGIAAVGVVTQTDILGGGAEAPNQEASAVETPAAPAATETATAPVTTAEVEDAPVETAPVTDVATATSEVEPVETAQENTTVAVEDSPAVATETTEPAPQEVVVAAPPLVVEPAPGITSEAWPTENTWVAVLPPSVDVNEDVAAVLAPAQNPTADALLSSIPVPPEVDVTADIEAILAPAANPSATELLALIEEESFVPTIPPLSVIEPAPYELELLPELPQPQELALDIANIDRGSTVVLYDPLIPPTDPAAVTASREFAATLPETGIVEASISFDPTVPEPPKPEILAEPTAVFGMTQDWKVILPFGGLFEGLSGETRIFAVNEVEVASLEEFNAAVRQTVSDTENANVSLSVQMGTSPEDQRAQNWSLPVVQSTRLANGLEFEAIAENGGWITRVKQVPEDYNANIQPGDVIFGFIKSSQVLSGRHDMGEILAKELEAGNTQFSFAVKRGEDTWVVSFDYDPKEYESTN